MIEIGPNLMEAIKALSLALVLAVAAWSIFGVRS